MEDNRRMVPPPPNRFKDNVPPPPRPVPVPPQLPKKPTIKNIDNNNTPNQAEKDFMNNNFSLSEVDSVVREIPKPKKEKVKSDKSMDSEKLKNILYWAGFGVSAAIVAILIVIMVM